MRAVVAAMLGLLGGCDIVFDLERVAPAPIPTGQYIKTLTIAQPTASELVSFPLSVILAADADLAKHVAFADDISFQVDGEGLPCEIVRYDASVGLLDAWVRAPALRANGEPTEVDLIYGLPSTPCAAAGMWPAPHVAVWHGDLATDRTRDSTPHAHDLTTTVAAGLPARADGLAGDALLFDGNDDSLCDAIDDDGSLNFDETQSFTFSAWINASRFVGAYDMPVYKGGSSQSGTGFNMSLGTGEWRADISDGTHTAAMQSEYVQPGQVATWYQLVTVIDRDMNTVRSYVNGSATDTASLTGWGSFATTQPMCLSRPADLYAGLIDEVRVTAQALSPDWIEVEHINLARPQDLIKVGPETAFLVP